MRSYVAAFAAVLGAGSIGRAATLCVNPGGTGGCFAAIQDAVEAAADGDLIDVAAGTYAEHVFLFRPGGVDLTLQGAGAHATILDGGGTGPALVVRGGSRVFVSNLRLLNGNAACLRAETAEVTVVDSVIEACRLGILATRIHERGARVTLIDSTVRASGPERAFYITERSRVRIVRSTISGNTGGALLVAASRVSIDDSTISGNSTSGDGGAILAFPGARVTVRHSTIAANSAASGGGLAGPSATRGRIVLQSSILADNTAGAGPDCATSPLRVVSRGFNVIESTSGCSVSARPTDVLGQDPMLGPLQDNGGATLTHALGASSPALGVVPRPRLCTAPDQRGTPRAAPCDAGAFEAP